MTQKILNFRYKEQNETKSAKKKTPALFIAKQAEKLSDVNQPTYPLKTNFLLTSVPQQEGKNVKEKKIDMKMRNERNVYKRIRKVYLLFNPKDWN